MDEEYDKTNNMHLLNTHHMQIKKEEHTYRARGSRESVSRPSSRTWMHFFLTLNTKGSPVGISTSWILSVGICKIRKQVCYKEWIDTRFAKKFHHTKRFAIAHKSRVGRRVGIGIGNKIFIVLTSHKCIRSPLIAFSEDAMRTFFPCAMLSGTILST